MDFTKLSRPQADQYLEHVVRREPARLADLAHWMAGTGGPIAEMDATLESLVPLNEWYVGFLDAGCPGVPRGVRPSWFGHDPDEEEQEAKASDPERVADFVAESLEHYLLLVCKNYNPAAHWAVYDSKPRNGMDVNYHSTGISFGPRGPHMIVYVNMGIFTDRILNGDVARRRPGALLEMLRLNVGSALKGKPLHKGISVLAPYLSGAQLPLDDESRRPPYLNVPSRKEVDHGTRSTQVGEEMILAKGSGEDLERPDQLAPLPIDAVGAALAALGFEAEEGRSLAEVLTLDDASLISAKVGAVVSTSVVDGNLRAILIEPVDPSRTQWAELNASFRALAREIGARFGPQDSW